MTGKDYFYLNQHMEIAGPAEDFYYHTWVWKVLPQSIQVLMPKNSGRYFLPQDGSLVRVRFVSGEALYSFMTNVAGKTSAGAEPLLVMNKPERLNRIQRRDYYRHPVLLKAEYSLIADIDKSGHAGHGDWVRAYTLDVSGGGLRFASEKRLREGIALQMRLYLPARKEEPSETVEMAGEIIRAFPRRSKGDQYVYCLQFSRIEEAQRDRIIRFIFADVRKRIR